MPIRPIRTNAARPHTASHGAKRRYAEQRTARFDRILAFFRSVARLSDGTSPAGQVFLCPSL